jgi:hypothetical protein
VSRVAQSIWYLATGLTTGRSRFDTGRGERIFLPTFVSRPTLGPTQPPVQYVPGVLSPGVKRGRGVTLTTHPHLLSRSRMSRSYNSSPPSAFVACSRTALALDLNNYLCNFTKSMLTRILDSWLSSTWLSTCLYGIKALTKHRNSQLKPNPIHFIPSPHSHAQILIFL